MREVRSRAAPDAVEFRRRRRADTPNLCHRNAGHGSQSRLGISEVADPAQGKVALGKPVGELCQDLCRSDPHAGGNADPLLHGGTQGAGMGCQVALTHAGQV